MIELLADKQHSDVVDLMIPVLLSNFHNNFTFNVAGVFNSLRYIRILLSHAVIKARRVLVPRS